MDCLNNFPILFLNETEHVGIENSIELSYAENFFDYLGRKVTSGNIGTIYEVRNDPTRLYKVIPLQDFKNGDEIRISQLAAEAGVAPSFYGAFLVKQGIRKFVVIEMENRGKSLSKWMEELREEDSSSEEPTQSQSIVSGDDDYQKAIQEMQKKFREMAGSVIIQEKKKASLETAISKLFKKTEDFYYHLFSKIQILVEKGIAYKDSHVGNILIDFTVSDEPHLSLIDFDSAILTRDPVSARSSAIQSSYNKILYQEFKKISNLSAASLKLIEWFSPEKLFYQSDIH